MDVFLVVRVTLPLLAQLYFLRVAKVKMDLFLFYFSVISAGQPDGTRSGNWERGRKQKKKLAPGCFLAQFIVAKKEKSVRY